MPRESVFSDCSAAQTASAAPAIERAAERFHRPEDVAAQVGGIILAGAQSWGACVLEEVLPRALTPIVNRPLISYLLGWLRSSGIQSTSICSNSHAQRIRRGLFEDGATSCVPADMKIDYYEDIAPRGPAGCIRDVANHCPYDVFVVVDGTIVPQIDIMDLLTSHHRSGASVTVVVSGNEPVDGIPGTESLTPVGIYVFSRRSLEHVQASGFQDIKETLIPRLYRKREPVVTYRARGAAPRIQGVDSYLAVNDWVLNDVLDTSSDFSDYRRIGESYLHPSVSVDSTVRLIGPILVGVGSRIGRGVTLVGPTTIGAHCTIGERAVVCRSSVWDDCTVDPGSILDRCILTRRSHVRSDSAYRYVVFTEHRRKFPRFGRLVSRWIGTDEEKLSSSSHARPAVSRGT